MLLLSKLAWAALQPMSLILILVAVGLALTFTRFKLLARFSLGIAATLVMVLAFSTFGHMAIGALEDRFPRKVSPPEPVTGIIVLGGGMDADVNEIRRGYELNRSGDRFVEALRLALLYPESRIVISGGADMLGDGTDTEAEAGARFFEAFGVARSRLILEDMSRTTGENAARIRERLAIQPGETWLLVTSAFHMPRSMGLFRKSGLDVVPWPADYLSSGAEGIRLKLFSPAENMAVATMAIREWLALLSYWVTGRIDDLIPSP